MKSYTRTLWAVVAVTVGAGCIETALGLRQGSSLLVKDGAEWAYGATIYTIAALTYGRSAATEYKAGLLVALILAIGGVQGSYEIVSGLLSGLEDDDAVGLAASSGFSMIGALVVAGLLIRFRNSDDPVIEGSWLAARNDVVTSALDLGVVFILKLVPSRWPQVASDAIGVALAFRAASVVAHEALRMRTGEQLRSSPGKEVER
jgi:Co/Zn/Cd efflux system component